MTEPRASGSTEHRPGTPASPEEQRVELEELREELGETVEELARRVDVPARVKARREELVTQAKARGDELVTRGKALSEQAKATVAEKAPVVQEQVRQNPTALAAGAATALVVFTLIMRSGRRRPPS